MNIDYQKLESVFRIFSNFVAKKDGKPFVSFSSRYIYEQEKYKERLYDRADDALRLISWSKKDIGSGKIGRRVVSAIEVEDNNLVWTQDRRGPGTAEHTPLIKALDDKTHELEALLWDHFKEEKSLAETFPRFRVLLGDRYSLISYLYFIKDKRRFLPLRTRKFEDAFKKIGVNLRFSHQASHENYSAFLKIIDEVRIYLEGQLKERVQLLDAHSFLWILTGQMQKEINIDGEMEKRTEIEAIHLDLIDLGEIEIKEKKRENKTGPVYFDEEKHYKEEVMNKITGERGEHAVLEYERLRLEKEGRLALSKQVSIVSANIALGYDILSFSNDGKERYIEVKASRGEPNHFFLSRNEYDHIEMEEGYWIYVVHTVFDNPRIVLMIHRDELFNNSKFLIEACSYKVIFTPQKEKGSRSN
ncbi:MAG: DUF3883 domain-containing protein [Candidatus Paceibacterota bacterium]